MVPVDTSNDSNTSNYQNKLVDVISMSSTIQENAESISSQEKLDAAGPPSSESPLKCYSESDSPRRPNTPPPATTSPIPLGRTFSSPPVIDPSPKPQRATTPPSPHYANNNNYRDAHLTPVIRNTTSEENNDSIVISPDDTKIKDLQLDIPDNKELFSSSTTPKPIRVSSRARTVGNLDSQILQTDRDDPPRTGERPPIDKIPLHRSNRSFGSNKQYRRALVSALRSLSTQSPPPPSAMSPQYQPSRDTSLTEVGLGDNLEDLSAIFLPRKKNSMNMLTSDATLNLHQPIPMDEKQWSIPSIRLANGLNDFSTASYTCSDDESDLWEEDIIVANFEEFQLSQIIADDAASDASLSDRPCCGTSVGDNESEVRETSPLEWLRQVRESENVLAEAASSKFLTNRVVLTPAVERQALQTLNRVGGLEQQELFRGEKRDV